MFLHFFHSLHSSSSISDRYLVSKTGAILSRNMDVASVDAVVSVEVDLREGSERRVHWFVDGKQQKPFMVNVPRCVQFAVCFILFLFIIHSSSKVVYVL